MSRCRGKVRESGVCEQFALEKEHIKNYVLFIRNLNMIDYKF